MVISCIFRFYNTVRFKHQRVGSHEPVSKGEINFVKQRIAKLAQKVIFPEEYRVLSQKDKISSSSTLLCLNPFLDSNGVMHVSKRLTRSSDPSFDERNRMIIPYKCRLSRLMVQFTHQISLDGGHQLVHKLIRAQFYIPKVKNLIKFTINR